MIIREMLVEDLDQVMEMERELFGSCAWPREGYFTYLTKPDSMFLVVEEKGKILGYCGVLMILGEGDITNVAVSPKRQREGIGTFLVNSMIRLADEQGCPVLHLEVRESNAVARRLYKRLGFAEDGLRKNYYTDPAEDAVLMTRNGT